MRKHQDKDGIAEKNGSDAERKAAWKPWRDSATGEPSRCDYQCSAEKYR